MQVRGSFRSSRSLLDFDLLQRGATLQAESQRRYQLKLIVLTSVNGMICDSCPELGPPKGQFFECLVEKEQLLSLL